MIFSLSIINFGYAQNYSSSNSNSSNNNDNNSSNLITTNDTTTKTSSLSYKFEPILSLDGITFKDIPHNNTLTLNNFAIAAWINTNQQPIESETANLVNKGGFNSEKEGDNMNYGI